MAALEQVYNSEKELIGVRCGAMIFAVLDNGSYLASNIASRIRDKLENNIYSPRPRTLDEMKPFIRESLSMIEGAVSAVTDRDIEAMSWFLGKRVTQFYHGVWVESDTFVARGVRWDSSNRDAVVLKTKRRGREWRRWEFNRLLIGKDLHDIILRLRADEKRRRAPAK